MTSDTFAAAVNCVDGAIQDTVTNWIRHEFGVDFVDAITTFGPDRVLAHDASPEVEAIKEGVQNSIQTHGSRIVVIAGHAGCTGNPVLSQVHIAEIRQAGNRLASWQLPGTPRIMGIWVNTEGAVDVVYDSRPE